MVKSYKIFQNNSDGGNAACDVEWRVSDTVVDYPHAVAEMERRVAAIIAGDAPECVWLLEHPPTYTAGTSAKIEDLLMPKRFPVHTAGRGGQYTYHGPGQRIAYVMLDLNQRGKDIRKFVGALEDWVIETLSVFGITGEQRKGRVGVWVTRSDLDSVREDKIAAIGVRVRRWVTFHGISVNVNPELEHYSGIVPCGVQNHGVTSLADLGKNVSMKQVDEVLHAGFEARFGTAG